MSLRINDDCLNCFACISDCPNTAISEGDMIHHIDPDLCTECVGSYETPRCIKVCPVDTAIVWDSEHVESPETLLARWGRLHPGETPSLFDKQNKTA
jgi:ferredoxin